MASIVFSAQRRLKKIDSSKLFQGVVIAVIILSALLIGVKTHDLSENAVALLAILDLGVTVFFVIEISVISSRILIGFLWLNIPTTWRPNI